MLARLEIETCDYKYREISRLRAIFQAKISISWYRTIMMDAELELDTLLQSPEPDQVLFVRKMMTVLGRQEWRKRPIGDPRNLYRALGYLCSWVFYPEYPDLLANLPGNITKLHQQLHTSLRELQPEVASFYASLDDSEFSDIFAQPWALALLLLVPETAQVLLNAMSLERLMPALLFNLTYLPSQRQKISAYLGDLIQKPEGVYTLIQAFAQGEHKDTLRDLAVRVLGALPKASDRATYVSTVLGQCLSLLLNSHCEAYFRSIVSDTAANFLLKYAECAKTPFFSLLHPALAQKDIYGAIQALAALAARDPPPPLVLYILEEQFSLLFALDTAASHYPTLGLSADVRKLLVQVGKYSECAATLLYEAFIVGQDTGIGFELEGDRLVRTEIEKEEPAVRHLEHNISLLSHFSQSPLSSKVCSELFSLLLSEYVHSPSPLPLLYLASIAETLPAELLVQSAAQLSVFLRASLQAEDSATWQLALELLCAVLEYDLNALDKALLVDISKEVISLCSAEDSELASFAQRANSLISRSLLQFTAESNTSQTRDLPPQLLKDLHSSQPFERAFALHHLSLLPSPELQTSASILPHLYQLLQDQDSFVFQNVLKLWLKLVKIRTKEAMEGVLRLYPGLRDWQSKAHVLELLFHAIIAMGRVTVYAWALPLMQFLTGCEEDELLLNGKLSVLGELVKYLGPALHPYLGYIIGLSLACLRTASSALYQHQSQPSSLVPVLLIVTKLLRNSPISHLQSRLEELTSVLSTLFELGSEEMVGRELLVQALDAATLLAAQQYGLKPIQ